MLTDVSFQYEAASLSDLRHTNSHGNRPNNNTKRSINIAKSTSIHVDYRCIVIKPIAV